MKKLKWFYALWKIRGDRRFRQTLHAVQSLTWPQRLALLRGLLADPRVSPLAKAAPLLLVAYLMSPLDVIPDFIPGIGQIDDMFVTGVLFRAMQRSLPPELIEEHLRRVRATTPFEERPRRL